MNPSTLRALKEGKERTIRALKEGKERIKRGWCKGASGRDAENGRVLAHHPAAVQWCATGAVEAEGVTPISEACQVSLRSAARVAGLRLDSLGVVGWNDHPLTQKKHVLGLYDLAIWLEENDR